ncbi:MAG: HAMP domain-containing sensor histidine kinase, partial [Pseudomonadota bacterium]
DPIKTDRLDDAPVLILNVSAQGRIRSIIGQDRLLPDIRLGADLAPKLDEASGVAVTRMPASDGSWVIVVPQSEDADADRLSERTSFFAGLGHDLKSPLNAVIGFAEIMESELRGPMPEAYQDYPGLIKESGETLLRLVEDMLAYARSEAGTYELDMAPMDIAASGESVLRQSQAVADKAEVTLKFSGHGEVMAIADADAVRRMWDNLVSNAIKYSSPGDVVTLTASMQGEASLLQVIDTGAGMDADDLARIARPFAQGRNSKGRVGTGLGLATVQRLAEMQGGQVEIRTAPGAGTTVSVTLPAYAADTKRAAE